MLDRFINCALWLLNNSISGIFAKTVNCSFSASGQQLSWMKLLGLVAAGFMAMTTTPGEADCRKALALGLDVSNSVDATEYRLQLNGLANALLHSDVQAAFLAIPSAPVRIFVFEWAGPGSQRRIVDWMAVQTAADLETVAAVLRERQRFKLLPSTALGEAMLYGGAALSTQAECWQRVLDISGDGRSNIGVLPRDLTEDMLPGVTVNGLVVGLGDEPDHKLRQAQITNVVSYYMTDVIRGPGAFVETASSFRDFEEAMARKLLRELQSLAIVHLHR